MISQTFSIYTYHVASLRFPETFQPIRIGFAEFVTGAPVLLTDLASYGKGGAA